MACKLGIMIWLMMLLSACAPNIRPQGQSSEVAEAFETSSVMKFKPYTRTIFSSTDF